MSDSLAGLDWERLAQLGRTASGELLRHAAEHPTPPAGREVFVNRTLRLQTIRYVGFDLDWTLADYDRLPLEELTFRLAIERLIEREGFPERIRELELRPHFPRRGLLIDKREGVVLRMNRHRYVGQAYLGRRRLGPADSMRLYRRNPINPASSRFYHVDSLFELPETNLYSELVELSLVEPGLGLPPYPELFDRVRTAIDGVHRDGLMKERVLAAPGTYLHRTPELALALQRLALGQRRLILITNSPWGYTRGVCSYLLDGALPGLASWRQLFDLVIVDSAKPGFFRNGRPFRALDAPDEEGAEVAVPSWGSVYSGGSLSGLMQLLDCPGEQVLYVGDHIYGDIVTSKTESTWRTALIVRELEEEFRHRAALGDEIEALAALRRRLAALGHRMDRMGDVLDLVRRLEADGEGLPESAGRLIQERFRRLKREHRTVLRETQALAESTSAAFNPYWGSFFKQDASKTLFASQLEAYACLYTSRVSNFSFYGSNHYFRVLQDPMKHEEGDGSAYGAAEDAAPRRAPLRRSL